jgi:hypothetical protein
VPVLQQEEEKPRPASPVGCVFAGVILILVLIGGFFALPFFNLNGWLVTRAWSPAEAESIRDPQGFSVTPDHYQGQSGTAYILRVGNLGWAVHGPRQGAPDR